MIQFGRFQLRRVDERNMLLYERRTIGQGKRAGEVDWMPTGNYFHDLRSALGFLLRRLSMDAVGDEGAVLALREAIAELERLSRELADELDRAAARLERARGLS